MAVATTQAALAKPASDPCPFPTLITPSPRCGQFQFQSSPLPPHTICIKCSNVALLLLAACFICFIVLGAAHVSVCVCEGVGGEEKLNWQRQHVAFVVLTLYKHNHM